MELLVSTFNNFLDEGNGEDADKAVFEKAMQKRIDEDGYKMLDLLFELVQCQRAILKLQELVQELTESKIQKCSESVSI